MTGVSWSILLDLEDALLLELFCVLVLVLHELLDHFVSFLLRRLLAALNHKVTLSRLHGVS